MVERWEKAMAEGRQRSLYIYDIDSKYIQSVKLKKKKMAPARWLTNIAN